jgi:hypothetical protein
MKRSMIAAAVVGALGLSMACQRDNAGESVLEHDRGAENAAPTPGADRPGAVPLEQGAKESAAGWNTEGASQDPAPLRGGSDDARHVSPDGQGPAALGADRAGRNAGNSSENHGNSTHGTVDGTEGQRSGSGDIGRTLNKGTTPHNTVNGNGSSE